MSNPHVLISTTKGDVLVELFADKAPKTVENFLAYADDGFYGGAIFHRVIKGFMVQGGGLTFSMKEKETKPPVENEADNGVANERGTLAMARTPDPHSASSQFFINMADNAFLNHQGKTMEGWGYCAFGRVIDGMDVVDAIEKVRTKSLGGHDDVPVDAVTITSVERFEL